MSAGKGWDMTSLHSLESGAEWMRKKAGALLVLVVRSEDIAFAVDPDIAPADAKDMVEFVMPQVQEQLRAARLAAREASRAKEEKVTKKKGWSI